jgi:hypothetical protein
MQSGTDEEFKRFLQPSSEERERRSAEREAHSIFLRKSFSPEDIERVLKAAEPIPPETIEVLDRATGETRKVARQDEIERRLSSLSAFVHYSSEQKKVQLTPSDLVKRFHAIAAAANTLLKEIWSIGPISKRPPPHVHDVLGRVAEREIAEDESKIAAEGGASQNTPLLWRAGTVTSTDYAGDIRFRNNVHGVVELRDWARRAEREARARVGRDRGADESLKLRIDRWDANPIADALDVIFRIWQEVLQRELNTGSVNKDGRAGGPLVKFTRACLVAVGAINGRDNKPMGPDAVRAHIRRVLSEKQSGSDPQ